jgi:hypothetical protein
MILLPFFVLADCKVVCNCIWVLGGDILERYSERAVVKSSERLR